MDRVLDLLNSLLPSMWRYRWGGLTLAIVLGLCGAIVALTIPNRYETSARVHVDTQSILKPLMHGLAIQPNLDQQIALMARSFISRPNLEKVVRMSGLDQKAATPAERDALLDSLTRDIRFSFAGSANLYSITYRSESPEIARQVVQSLLDIFVETNLEDKQRDSDQARDFIDEQIASYEQRLQAAERSLRDFKIKHLGSLPSERQDYVSSTRPAKEELDQATNELRQAESGRDALKRETALQTPDTVTLTEAERPPTATDARLGAARARLDELLIRFTDSHPDVLAVKHVISQLEAQKVSEAKAGPATRAPARPGLDSMVGQGAYSVIRASLAAAEAQAASLRVRVIAAQAKVAAAARAAQSVPQVEAQLTQLNRDYDINKRNYEELLRRRESAKMGGSMESSAGTARFRVVEPPRANPNPVFPNRLVFFAVALAASIAAGIAYTFLRGQLRPAFFTVASLREVTALPSIGTVSQVQWPADRWRMRVGALTFSAMSLLYVFGFAASVYVVSRFS